MKKLERKWLSILISLVLLMTSIPISVLAEDSINIGLCEHHTSHTSECGYAEARGEMPCLHEHGESCYVTERNCIHTHDEFCGYAPATEGSPCGHIEHTPECGYKAAVAEVLCSCAAGEDGVVVHVENCGYVAAEEEIPCSHVEQGHTAECGYAEPTMEMPCTHACSVENGCVVVSINCQHVSHDENCGYQAARESSICSYQCGECAAEKALMEMYRTTLKIEAAEGGYRIYANGIPLVITQGSLENTETIFIDENKNGQVDSGEKSLKGMGIPNAPEDDTDLGRCVIYGSDGLINAEQTQISVLGGNIVLDLYSQNLKNTESSVLKVSGGKVEITGIGTLSGNGCAVEVTGGEVNISEGYVAVDENGMPVEAITGRGFIEIAEEQVQTLELQTLTADDFVFTPPLQLRYDGSQKQASVVSVTSLQGTVGEITIKYFDSKGTLLESAPTAAGTYTVKIDVVESASYQAVSDLTSETWKFTIDKIKISSFSAPMAKGDIYYSGAEQELVTGGAVTYEIDAVDTSAAILYSLDGNSYSSAIPTATAVGQYTVYYKVELDQNYEKIEPNTIIVDILPNPFTVGGIDESYTYTGSPIYPEVVVESGGTVLEKGNDYQVAYGENISVSTGGSVKVTLCGNYSGEKEVFFRITKNTGSGEVAINDWVYGETPSTPELIANTNVSSAEEVQVTYLYRGIANDGRAYEAEYPPTAAGTYTVTAIVAATEKYESYTTSPCEFTIHKKELTLASLECHDSDRVVNKIYDGTVSIPGEQKKCIGIVVEGLASSDVAEFRNITYAFADANAGENIAVKATDIQLSERTAYNYTLASTEISSNIGMIEKAPLTVTAGTGNVEFIHYGEEAPALTVSYEGFRNGETTDVLEGTLVLNCEYDTGNPEKRNVGLYDIVPSGLSAKNYHIEYVYGQLEVVKKNLALYIDDQVISYGDDAPVYTYRYVDASDYSMRGYAYDDDFSDIDVPGSIECAYVQGDSTGTKQILSNNYGSDNNYHMVNQRIGTLTVQKKPLKVAANDNFITYGEEPVANGVVYDGFVLNETEVVLGGTLEYEFAYRQFDDVGEYAITPKGLTSGNYDILFVDGELYVEKAPLSIEVNPVEKIYGEADPELSYTVLGLVNGDTLTGNLMRVEGEDAGIYHIGPGTLSSTSNYKVTFKQSQMTIHPKPISAADVKLDGSLIYTGEEQVQKVTVTEGITYDVTGNIGTDAGTYELVVKGTGNYCGEVKMEWSINDGVAEIENVPTANELVFNGSEQALVIAGTANGGTVLYSLAKDGTYAEEIPIGKNAGTYTIWYYAAGDENHADSEKYSIEVTIKKARPSVGKVTAKPVNDTTDIAAVIIESENVNIEGTFRIEKNQKLSLGENEITCIFVPTDSENYEMMSGKVKVVVQDTIAPTGMVKLGSSNWTEFVKDISFGKYFNATQTISVEADDTFSGMKKIEYYESTRALTLEEVKALSDTQWKEMKGNISVTAEDAKQFVYYIRLTDHCGNISYLSTDGGEFDMIPPVISGVKDGETYYTTQKLTVSDRNLEKVTLNGEELIAAYSRSSDKMLILDGNENTTYTITATDKAGNSTTVTVNMSEISSMTAVLKDIDESNVTSASRKDLENILYLIDILKDDENLTGEEAAALDKVKGKAEILLSIIEETAESVVTENTKKVENLTANTVKPGDKADLQTAKSDLETALKDNSSHFTEEEKQAIREEIARIDAALQTLKNAENMVAAINKLPNTVEEDDENAIKAVQETKKVYDALTEHEKSLMDEAAKAKLKKLVDIVNSYVETDDEETKLTENVPKTADESGVEKWLLAMAASVLLLLLARKRKLGRQ